MRLNTIVNYYKGNNPHYGGMRYDNGHEYFKYFKNIFKYPYENDLFDERCYENYLDTLENEIANIGFSGLINTADTVIVYDTMISADTKISYFGNYKGGQVRSSKGVNGREATDGAINKLTAKNELTTFVYTSDEDVEKSYNEAFSAQCKNVKKYFMKDADMLKNENYEYAKQYGKMYSNAVDEITNQIVNNKRIKITFYLRNNPISEEDGVAELKYLDSVVMNYLTQVIPSTAILEVEYSFSSSS